MSICLQPGTIAHVSRYINKSISFFPYLFICCSNSWIFAAFWMFLGFGLVTRGTVVFGASSRLNQSDISDLFAKSLSNSSWITRAAKDKLASETWNGVAENLTGHSCTLVFKFRSGWLISHCPRSAPCEQLPHASWLGQSLAFDMLVEVGCCNFVVG
jgi:hypothetical protein